LKKKKLKASKVDGLIKAMPVRKAESDSGRNTGERRQAAIDNEVEK
jgi:hypothetical protein